MKKIIYLFLFFVFFISCTTTTTEDSIEGTWLVTHLLGMPVSDGAYYYKFNSNGTFYRDTEKNNLKKPKEDEDGEIIKSKSPEGFGKYSVSGGTLKLKFSSESSGENYTFDASYNNSTMFWSNNGIEQIRLTKK